MTRLNRIYLYNFLNAMSLTVVGDFMVLDLFLLRIRAGVSTIGFIKSLTFFVPVIAYQLCVPYLEKKHNEVPLCAWSYLIRVTIPALLPAFALAGMAGSWLNWMCIAILPLAVTLATFANNALMIVYRSQLPPRDYNRCVGVVQMLYRVPVLLMLPVAMLFEYGSAGGDARFFLVYLISLLCFGAFQIPAVATLMPLGKVVSENARRSEKPSFSALYRPYVDPGYRGVLATTILHGAVTGGGNAYVAIYCLKVMDLSIFHVSSMRVLALIAGMVALPFAGKLADRIGYRRIFVYAGALLALGLGAFVAFPHPWMLPLFALLFWDGTSSPVGGTLLMCEQNAAARLAPENGLTGYIAAFNVAQGAGLFAGALGGGMLFDLLKAGEFGEGACFRIVMGSWLPCLALLVLAAQRWLPKEPIRG